MEKKKSLWEQMGRNTGSSDMDDKKKKEEKGSDFWSGIKSKFQGPNLAETITDQIKKRNKK